MKWARRSEFDRGAYVYRVDHPLLGLVYIGCTADPEKRLKALRRVSWWGADCEMRLVAFFGERRDALDHELSLIRELRPRHNRQANPDFTTAGWRERVA